MDAFEIWQTKKPRLIGPHVLTLGYEGRYFFHGPFVYYFLLPGLLIGNWDPISGSITTIIWNILGVIFLYLIGLKAGSKLLAFLLGLIYATNPFLINYTSFIWNPNFLPFISIILTYFLLIDLNQKKAQNIFLIGFLFGVGLLCHYQMILVFPLLIISLFYLPKFHLNNFLKLIFGSIIGLAPMIIFELKNNFYNTKTVFYILANRQSGFSFSINYYFLAPIIIFNILIITLFFQRISARNQKYFLLIFSIITLINIFLGTKTLTSMSDAISLPELKKASAIIIQKKLTNFNIANLTTGNTRANALRYLLIYQGLAPMGVEEYSLTENLFILSDNREDEHVEQNSVWEISVLNGKVIDKWQLSENNNYYLFLLKRQ